jgi:hypothetical protein
LAVGLKDSLVLAIASASLLISLLTYIAARPRFRLRLRQHTNVFDVTVVNGRQPTTVLMLVVVLYDAKASVRWSLPWRGRLVRATAEVWTEPVFLQSGEVREETVQFRGVTNEKPRAVARASNGRLKYAKPEQVGFFRRLRA